MRQTSHLTGTQIAETTKVAAGQPIRPGSAEAETRNRQEYYADLRTAVSTEESTTARRITAEEQAAAEKWGKEVGESRWMWSEYQRRWPPRNAHRSRDPTMYRVPARRGHRSLNPEANGRVEAACDRIAERERQKISPAMRAIESQDPDRHLIGFEHRLKGRDRIKGEGSADAIRTFAAPARAGCFACTRCDSIYLSVPGGSYTQGVWADIGRLKDQGFQLHSLWNAWSKDQYKGINSQWIDPDSGQRFEVQFHTRISFEAKQLTHDAYERLRTQRA